MTIGERQKLIVMEFNTLFNWEERYRRIIEYGRELPPMTEAHKTDKNKVKGCQSTVWLHAALSGNSIVLEGESDSMIVQGLIALLLKVYNGATLTEVVITPPEFIESTGLGNHLLPTRTNGLAAIIKQIKMYAAVFKAMQDLN